MAVLVLSGCMTTGTTPAGIGSSLGNAAHGGGVAYMANGEKLTIDQQGVVSDRCQLCQLPEDGLAACKAAAEAKGISICAEAVNISVPRGQLMCPVVAGPHVGSIVPFGSPGYTCYMTSGASCICFG